MSTNSYSKKYTDREPGRYTSARLVDPQQVRLASFIKRHSRQNLTEARPQEKELAVLTHVDSDDLSTSIKELDLRLNSLRAEHTQAEKLPSRFLSKTTRSTTPTNVRHKPRDHPRAVRRDVSPSTTTIKSSHSQSSFANKKEAANEGLELLSKSLDQRKKALDELERSLQVKRAEVSAKEKQVEQREQALSQFPTIEEMKQFALSLRDKEQELDDREQRLVEIEQATATVKRKIDFESDELQQAEPLMSPRFQDSSKLEDLRRIEEDLQNTARELEERTDALMQDERDMKLRQDKFRQQVLTIDQKGRELAKFAEMLQKKEHELKQLEASTSSKELSEDVASKESLESLQKREADLDQREAELEAKVQANQAASHKLTQEFESLKIVKAKLEAEAKRQQEGLLRSSSGGELREPPRDDSLSRREGILKQKEQMIAEKLKLLASRYEDIENRERALRREELSVLSLSTTDFDSDKAQALDLKEAELNKREQNLHESELKAAKNEEELKELRAKLHSREDTIQGLMQKLETSFKQKTSIDWSLVDIESIQFEDQSLNESHKYSSRSHVSKEALLMEKARQVDEGKITVEEMLLEMDSSDRADSFELESVKKRRSGATTELSLDLE